MIFLKNESFYDKKKLKSYDDDAKNLQCCQPVLNASQLQSGNLPPNTQFKLRLLWCSYICRYIQSSTKKHKIDI